MDYDIHKMSNEEKVNTKWLLTISQNITITWVMLFGATLKTKAE